MSEPTINYLKITRRIRACEGEVAAQLLLESLARLVAEDCAKLLQEHHEKWDETISPDRVIFLTAESIRAKYAPLQSTSPEE